MPDWRRPEDYAYTKGLDLRQWAWEFCRRSTSYRELWAAHTAMLEKEWADKEVGDEVEIPVNHWRLAAGRFGLLNRIISPEARADQAPDFVWGWSVGLKQVPPPKGKPDKGPRYCFFGNTPMGPTSIFVGFDLLMPIDPQLRAAATELRSERKRLDDEGHATLRLTKVRKRPALWTTYLRLLDAGLERVSISEMGRVIFKDKGDPRKSAQNALRKAVALADRDYLDFLMHV